MASTSAATPSVQDFDMPDRPVATPKTIDASVSVNSAVEFGPGSPTKLLPFTKQTFNFITVLFKKRYELYLKRKNLGNVKYVDITFLPSSTFLDQETRNEIITTTNTNILNRKRNYFDDKVKELSSQISEAVNSFEKKFVDQYKDNKNTLVFE